MEKLFGTDGIRGHAGEFPLDPASVQIIGASLARQFNEKSGRPPRFITGRDTRESGESIESDLTAGALSENAKVRSAGVITTPGVAFLARHLDFDAGIVISASHNPFEDNGIKVFLHNGKKLDEQSETAIENDIHTGASVSIPKPELDVSQAEEFRSAYLDYLAGGFPGLSLSGVRIVVDCANGAACGLAPTLFNHLGAEVISLNDAPNGKNINRDCGSLHLEGLQAKVIGENADFGVAFDGDADRALFVDEKGKIVDGDATLWILGRHFQDHGKLTNSKIIATVMSNIGLEIALRSRDIDLVRAPVGDKYVLDELIRSGSAIGGEQSGHIIIPEKSLVGDGMMTTLFMLQTMREKNAKLADLSEGFVRYPQVLVNVKVREKKPFDDVSAIADAARLIEKKLEGNGRLLLRYSGTENLARVMIEGKDQTDIDQSAHHLADVIKAALG
jgi:phosphoglucosamine mutase